MTKFQLRWQGGGTSGIAPHLYDSRLEPQGIADRANKKVEKPNTPMKIFWWVVAVIDGADEREKSLKLLTLIGLYAECADEALCMWELKIEREVIATDVVYIPIEYQERVAIELVPNIYEEKNMWLLARVLDFGTENPHLFETNNEREPFYCLPIHFQQTARRVGWHKAMCSTADLMLEYMEKW